MANIPALEREVRIKEIVSKIRKGWSRAKIIDYIISTYKLTKGPAYKLMGEAYERLAVKCEKQIEAAREIQIDRIENILQSALEAVGPDGKVDPDNATALKCLDMLNRIFALYTEKKDVTIDGKTLRFEFGDDLQPKTEENI